MTIINPYSEAKVIDLQALGTKVLARETVVTGSTATALPVSILVVTILQWCGFTGLLWLIPIGIVLAFVLSLLGVNGSYIRTKLKAKQQAVAIPWYFVDEMQGLYNAILKVSEDKRNTFRSLWDSAEAQCLELKEPTEEEKHTVNAFLRECTSTVNATVKAEAELISVLSKKDPTDPAVIEAKEIFSLNMASTAALEEAKANLTAIREATKEFEARAG